LYQAEKVTRGRGKKKEKSSPTDNQLHDAICEILKEVDFNTVRYLNKLQKVQRL